MQTYHENLLEGDLSWKHVILPFQNLMHIQEDQINQLGTFIKYKECTPQDQQY